MSDHPDDIDLATAQRLVGRAVDKAEQLGISGAIAVVGASGALVTASRMDEGGAGGLGRARSKAWIAATQRIPSTEHLDRRYSIVDGVPANPEDQVVAHALDVPYVGQHGDDKPRWEARYGEWQDHAAPPPVAVPGASAQPELAAAVALTERVLASGQPVAVVVVDRRGEAVHQAAADDAPTAATYVAEGVAAAAALFGRPSGEVADLVTATRHVLPVPVVGLPGGRPLPGGGALGVAGPAPEVCEKLAAEALA